MATFQSLGQLSTHLAENGIEVVDPGIPLADMTALGPTRDVWKSQPSVRKVVDFIARNVASIPLHVYERVSDEDRRRITDHPLTAVLTSPAPNQVPFRFWHGVLCDWMLHDRWCVRKVPQLDGTMQLVRIPARRFRFVADGLDRVAAIDIWSLDGQRTREDPSDFLCDHGYAARGANGTSPMETLADILAEASEAVAYKRGVLQRGARIPAVLERPADAKWEPAARERFIQMWRRFTRSGGQEGGTPILEDGMVLKKVDAFSPRDLGDLEGRKLTDAEVASAFHIPPELVGAREGTNSNIEQYRQMLYRDSLGPLIEALEQVINVMLVPDLADGRRLYVEANVDSKLRLSFEEQARVLTSAVGAPYMLRAEARARMNLPRIDHADELVVPLNVTEGGLANPRDTAPPPKAGGRS